MTSMFATTGTPMRIQGLQHILARLHLDLMAQEVRFQHASARTPKQTHLNTINNQLIDQLVGVS